MNLHVDSKQKANSLFTHSDIVKITIHLTHTHTHTSPGNRCTSILINPAVDTERLLFMEVELIFHTTSLIFYLLFCLLFCMLFCLLFRLLFCLFAHSDGRLSPQCIPNRGDSIQSLNISTPALAAAAPLMFLFCRAPPV